MKGLTWRYPWVGIGLLILALAMVGPVIALAAQQEAGEMAHDDNVTRWLAELKGEAETADATGAAAATAGDGVTPPVADGESAAALSLSGPYGDAAKISVDFFKVDLHNVFRLLGQVSGKNIVVDEEVSGTLTLALQGVPWTFVLDVIKNLNGLQSEERFNTILVFPKKKAVEWTTDERTGASGELVFQPPEDDRKGLEIKKTASAMDPPAKTAEAYRLIAQGQEAEAAEEYAKAKGIYEQALEQWPGNSILAKKLAALCLGHLDDNLAALRYAKQALQAQPQDAEAATYAAMALARLGKADEARADFEKALLSPSPPPLALYNYAVFCEEQGAFREALRLLQQYMDAVGPATETILMKAGLLAKLGRDEQAIVEYKAVLRSGGEIPWQMKRHAEARLEQLQVDKGGPDALPSDIGQGR